MTTYITRDPAVPDPPERSPLPVRTIPTLNSSVVILALGTILAVGGYILPTSVRFVMWPLAMIVPGHAIVSAVFGKHLDFGGFRRAGLSAALTLVSYPLIALTALVMGFGLTATVVSVGTFLLCGSCAFVVWRRERKEALGAVGLSDAPLDAPERVGRRLRLTELIVPFGAIGLAMLIALASLVVFPRKAPDDFNVIALDGTWALTARAVPANPNRELEVTYRVENQTAQVQQYEISAAIVDGPEWSGTFFELQPGEIWNGTTRGHALEGSCRSRLEIDMNVVSDLEDHFPLAVFFRDSTIDC